MGGGGHVFWWLFWLVVIWGLLLDDCLFACALSHVFIIL